MAKTVNTRIQNKHDLEVNWMRATGFIPLDGELVYYDKEVDAEGNTLTIVLNGETVPALPSSIDSTKRSTPIPFARYKIGDGVTPINDLAFFDKTISGTVTKEIGGISKNKVYTDATVADVLSDLLFPYVAPSSFSIATTESEGNIEYGTIRTISKVTPKFTLGSKPITSIIIGTTSGGSDIYSGSTATNNTAITLAEDKRKTYNGSTGGTIYCTISDGQTSLQDSATVTYKYYTYYAVTNTTDIPTSWTAVGSTSVTDISIAANAGQYIWIASAGNYSGICELNELSGKYNSAAETTKTTGYTLVNSKGYTCENKYNLYRLTSARSGSGTSKFKLA